MDSSGKLTHFPQTLRKNYIFPYPSSLSTFHKLFTFSSYLFHLEEVWCIPVGDKAIEELFLLVQDVGMEHVQVIIAPVDFRNGVEKPEIPGIEWDKILYDKIEQALEPFVG